jgi:hypothetical protein
MRRFTLLTLVALFALLLIAAVFQWRAGGPRLPCEQDPACRPSATATATPASP